jgi:multidrug resistance efflux pump
MQSVQPTSRILAPARSLVANVLVLAITIALAGVSVRLLQMRLTSVVSVDAVINGVLTEIRAPQEGVVEQLHGNTGQVLRGQQPLMQLRNQRVSQLAVRETQSRLTELESDRLEAEALLAQQSQLVQGLTQDSVNQRQLATQEQGRQVEATQASVQAAQSQLELASLALKRAEMLGAEGAVAQSLVDEARVEQRQRQADLKQLQAQSAALRSDLEATRLGLSLGRSRSGYDPAIRLQELQLQIAQQKKVVQSKKRLANSAKAELVQAQADVQRALGTEVLAPGPGVLWKMAVQPNQFVEKGDALGQLLDCRKRWVDAVVEEKAMRSITPGMAASIELYGREDVVLHGRVSLVRSGIGRLAAGQEVAVPMAPNLPRHSQVRVEIDPESGGQSATAEAQSFCYVGYTAKVRFEVKPEG